MQRLQLYPLPGFPKLAHAVLSNDGVYRYALYRSLDGKDWNASAPSSGPEARRQLLFIMLNPSTADEYHNDPTIEKLMKYGRAWGYQVLSVANLFAARETDSKRLNALHAGGFNLVGPSNDDYLLHACTMADKIVCGWGNEGIIGGRQETVMESLRLHDVELWCFKKNRNGTPVHPLYQRDAAEIVRYQ